MFIYLAAVCHMNVCIYIYTHIMIGLRCFNIFEPKKKALEEVMQVANPAGGYDGMGWLRWNDPIQNI